MKKIFFLCVMQSYFIEGHINFLQDLPEYYSDYGNCSMLENGELSVIRHFIKEGDIVFDVGANVGEWSSYALECRPAHIYAFEPITACCDIVRSKFISSDLTCVNVAFCDYVGEKKFFYYDSSIAWSGMSGFCNRPILAAHTPHPPQELMVQTETIDNFCKEHTIDHIDFLKIDTEGGERDIFKGSVEMLKDKKIKCIQFEYGGCCKDAGTTLQEMYTLLTNFDYKIYRIIGRGLIHLPAWRDSLENYEYSNFLALPNT